MKSADSKLLARLDGALAATRDPIRSACLRAERAGYRARQGHFDKARSELDGLRLQFAMHPHPEVSIWLCLLEGWIAYYENLDHSALDRMKRARALSAAARFDNLHAVSAAWLAHLHYAYNEFEQAARMVDEALGLAGADGHAAQARASLVVAEACHFAGRFDLAQPWYVEARTHARVDDDVQTLSAVNYNLAALQASQSMKAAVFGGADADALIRHAAASVESASNFDEWIGTLSLGSLLPLLRASIASSRSDFARALALYGEDFHSTAEQGQTRVLPALFADRAWCRCRSGDFAGARADVAQAERRIDPTIDSDDRALAHGRLAQVLSVLGDSASSQAHERCAQDALIQHRRDQARVLEAFAGLLKARAPRTTASAAIRTAPC
jgi:tetratricopeptide (TPR) repeat protein